MAFPGPMNLKEVFDDFQGRRMGLIKALTRDVDQFFEQCNPETENLCLYGFPNGTWEVTMPNNELPPDLPEPLVGINFLRDSMRGNDWLSLIAMHSDSWLLAIASYHFCRLNFNKRKRQQLFQMINDLPTVLEVVGGIAKTTKHQSANNNSKNKSNKKMSLQEKMPAQVEESEEDKEKEEDEESEEDEFCETTLCGACGQNDGSIEFWICCDICEIWFHGKCLKITPAKAEHMEHFACLTCRTNKRARV